MIIDNVNCYNYENYFNNIFSLYKGYHGIDKEKTLNDIIDLTGATKDKSIVYVSLEHLYQRNYFPSQILYKNLETYFPLYEEVFISNNIESYFVYNDDQTEKIILFFFHDTYYHCKAFFVSENPIKTLETFFGDVTDEIFADVFMYIPELFSIDNFELLHNSPPYFFISRMNDFHKSLDEGEYISIPKSFNKKLKFVDYVCETKNYDTSGRFIESIIYKINDKRFFNFVKIMPIKVYSYMLIGNKMSFITS